VAVTIDTSRWTFIGLQPPRVTTRLFATEAEARVWARASAGHLASHSGA